MPQIDPQFNAYIHRRLSLVENGVLEFYPGYDDMDDEKVEQLVQILMSPSEEVISIKEIVLISQNLGDRSANALATLNMQSLILTGNNIGPRGADSLAKNQSLETLDLSSNPIEDQGGIALFQSKSIRALTVNDCGITSSGSNRLLSSRILQSLSLSRNRVDDDGIPEFISENIRTLDLSNNFITSEGAKRLAKNLHIERLHLRDNQIGKEGILALNGNKAIEELSLEGNKLDYKASEVLLRGGEVELASNQFSKQVQAVLFSVLNPKKRKSIEPLYDNTKEKHSRTDFPNSPNP